jgi:hypothetical protein
MGEFIKAVPFKNFTSTVEVDNVKIVVKIVVNHIDEKHNPTRVESVLPMEIIPVNSR